jgi:hypothetical protein
MQARNFLRNAAVGMKCGFLEVPNRKHAFTRGIKLGMMPANISP